MNVQRPALLVGVVLLATACDRASPSVATARASATMAAPSTSSVATAAPPPACSATTCADATSLAVCTDGVISTERCKGEDVCAATMCVAPTDGSGAAISRARARRTSGDGFINAWSAASSVPLKAATQYLADGVVDGIGAKSFHPTCAADLYVQPWSRDGEKSAPSGYALAAVTVFSETARTVALAVGSSGKLTVSVNGKTVVEHVPAKGIGKRAWPDEQSVDVDLPRGASRVAVLLEASKVPEKAAGFFLRFRESNGAPAVGLIVAEAVESAACASSEIADLGVKLDVDKGGLSVSAAPAFRGLVPSVTDTKIDLALTGKSPMKTSFGLTTPLAPTHLSADGAADLAVIDGDRTLSTQKLPPFGALLTRAGALVDALGDLSKLPMQPGGRASLESHVRAVVKLITSGDDDTAFIERHLKRAEDILAQAKAGEDPYKERTGVVYRAYRTKVDGSLQPYVMYVPPSYTKGDALPLVVMSHGRNRTPELALRTLIGEAPDDTMSLKWAGRNWPSFPDQRAILLSVFGFDEGASHPLGEQDVLDVIDEVKREYRVDDKRVSLTGFSLGGTVAFFLPMHFPDVFSATSPLCGYPNLMSFQNVAGVSRAPWEDVMLAKRYIVNYAENGQYLTVHVVHGGLDSPERSQVFVDRYRDLGESAIFDVQDDLNHDVWDYGYKDGRMVHWLSHRARPESPKHVRFVTGEYRYDRSYWLRVIGMHDSTQVPRATVEAHADEKTSAIDVKTENLDAFEIDRAKLAPATAWSARFNAVIDGTSIAVPNGEEPLFFTRDAGKWALGPEPSRAGMKRHGVSGPIADVLHHAVVIVYGATNPAHASVNRIVAEELASSGLGPDIEYPVSARFPVISDRDATDEAIAGKSVVLIGSPEDNALTARWADKLPVHFSADAIEIRKKRYTGKGVGVSFIAPRPDAADEYVVVHAGLDVDGTLAARSLPRFLPDFVVYDARTEVERGNLLFDERPFIDGGFFDEHWE